MLRSVANKLLALLALLAIACATPTLVPVGACCVQQERGGPMVCAERCWQERPEACP